MNFVPGKNKEKSAKPLKRWFASHRPTNKAASIMVLAVIFVVGIGFSVYRHTKFNQAASQLLQPKIVATDMPGWWYTDYFGKAVCDEDQCKGEMDPDGDKLTNIQEYYYHSDPLMKDTNENGLTDGEDVEQNFDPSRPGKITFEEVMNKENLLGESLLLDQDVKTILAEINDPSNVPLNLPKASEIKVTYEESEKIYKDYANDLKNTTARYFAEEELDDVAALIEEGNEEDLKAIRARALMLSQDLKKITVPPQMVNLHKYQVTMYQLLAAVLPIETFNPDSPESDIWFEKAQALFLISQKITQEYERLKVLGIIIE